MGLAACMDVPDKKHVHDGDDSGVIHTSVKIGPKARVLIVIKAESAIH